MVGLLDAARWMVGRSMKDLKMESRKTMDALLDMK
jgi:hypothetical protein